ncbi:MAG: type II toxin-antitoxin system RelE/ParE family toxin [Roseococcus sp.]|nr:type II toxin-antitoxin system RelE/ParE family toxin [Roseococcus sp.]
MTTGIRFAPRAIDQLDALQARIEAEGGQARAPRCLAGLLDYCRSLALFPDRGARRDDIASGLRLVGWRRRAVIALIREGDAVIILDVFHGSQDVTFGRPDP